MLLTLEVQVYVAHSLPSGFRISLLSVAKQVSFDELRQNRAEAQLDIPLLSPDLRVLDHVLARQSDLDGEVADLQHLGNG